MLGAFVGGTVLVGITTMLTVVLEIASITLSPPSTAESMKGWLTASPDSSEIIRLYATAVNQPADQITTALSLELCELPLDSLGTVIRCIK